jgi:hypothetical protein
VFAFLWICSIATNLQLLVSNFTLRSVAERKCLLLFNQTRTKNSHFLQVREKQFELDRLAAELSSLQKLESSQLEFIEQFALQK